MSIQRQRKEEKVAQLQALFATAKIVVVAHYDGSTVADLTELRTELAANSGKFQITKNKLAKLAVEGTPAEVLKELFTGPTAIAISDDEGMVTHIPKTLVDFGKKYDKLRLLGGSMDGAFLGEAEVYELASLPSINDLRAKLIGLITQPASKIITILEQPSSNIARVLSARVAAGDSK